MYAYDTQTGMPQGGTSPGTALTPKQARDSVPYCASILAKDETCSSKFIGVSGENGRCWCVKAGDLCDQVKTQPDVFQFQKGLEL